MIEPLIVECESVKHELENYAAAHKTTLDSLDFDLLESYIFVGEKGASKLRLENQAANSLEQERLLNPDFEIVQHSKIRIHPKEKQPSFLITLHADKTFSKMFAMIRKGSKIGDKATFLKRFFEELSKKKALHGILVGIFENESLAEDVMTFLQQSSNEVAQDRRFLISISPAPITYTQDQTVIYDYKKNSPKKQFDKDRGFLWIVNRGDPILTVIKPKMGISGRDCYGHFVQAKEPIVKLQGKIAVSATIGTSEGTADNAEFVRYTANDTGVVEFDEFRQRLELKRRVVLDGIDFKKTGDIALSQDEDVELVIQSKDGGGDCIGQNTTISVKHLTVEGHVGDGAKVTAQKLSISGSTHSGSHIEGDDVTIHVHKGYLKAKDAVIENLEGGTVEAEKVTIENALGGSVNGKDIVITNLHDNTSVTGSESIRIQNPTGHANTITIEFGVFGNELKVAEEEFERLQTIKSELRDKKISQTENKRFYEKNKSSFESLVNHIKECKKQGREPPIASVRAIQNFMKIVNELKLVSASMHELSEQIKESQKELSRIESRIFDSCIEVEGEWKNSGNKIMFKTLFPRREILFSPVEGQMTKRIFLKRNSKTDILEIAVDNYVLETQSSNEEEDRKDDI